MPDPNLNAEQLARVAASSIAEQVPRDEHMEEEEKIMAGRPDVNLPALLTRDVQGG